MSASAYAENDMCNQDFSSKSNVTSAINPTYVKHVDALDAWRRREMTSVNYSNKARLMQLDGLGQKHHLRKGSVEMAFKVAQSFEENCFPVPSLKQETAFTAYRKMSPSATPTMEVDNYAALPWHIHRAGSKVARTKRRNTASKLWLSTISTAYWEINFFLFAKVLFVSCHLQLPNLNLFYVQETFEP